MTNEKKIIMKNSRDRAVVKPSLLYIFLGSIFIFALILFLASCTSTKKESITVMVPDGAISGKISVITNGKTVVSAQDFTVVQ